MARDPVLNPGLPDLPPTFPGGRANLPSGFDPLNPRPGPSDSFVRSGIPIIKDIPSGGRLGTVGQILSQVHSFFGASANNASQMFRFALAGWAYTLLLTATSIIEGILQDTTVKDTPEGKSALNLKTIVQSLAGMLKTFSEDHQNTLKSNKELVKGFNDTAKGLM